MCNHPELFERREVKSALFVSQVPYVIPRVVYRDGLLDTAIPSKTRLLHNLLFIHNPHHVHTSLFHSSCKGMYHNFRSLNIFCFNCKIRSIRFYHRVTLQKDVDLTANSEEPDQTASLGSVSSGFIMFTQPCRKIWDH